MLQLGPRCQCGVEVLAVPLRRLHEVGIAAVCRRLHRRDGLHPQVIHGRVAAHLRHDGPHAVEPAGVFRPLFGFLQFLYEYALSRGGAECGHHIETLRVAAERLRLRHHVDELLQHLVVVEVALGHQPHLLRAGDLYLRPYPRLAARELHHRLHQPAERLVVGHQPCGRHALHLQPPCKVEQGHAVALPYEQLQRRVDAPESLCHVKVAVCGICQQYGAPHLTLVSEAARRILEPHHRPEISLHVLRPAVVAPRAELAVHELDPVVAEERRCGVGALHHLLHLLRHGLPVPRRHLHGAARAEQAAADGEIGHVVLGRLARGAVLCLRRHGLHAVVQRRDDDLERLRQRRALYLLEYV